MKKIPAATARIKKVPPMPSPAAAADEMPLCSDWMLETGVDVTALESEAVLAVVARVDPEVAPFDACVDNADEMADVDDEIDAKESEGLDEVDFDVVVIVVDVALSPMIAESNKSRDVITSSPSVACGFALQAL